MIARIYILKTISKKTKEKKMYQERSIRFLYRSPLGPRLVVCDILLYFNILECAQKWLGIHTLYMILMRHNDDAVIIIWILFLYTEDDS